MERLTEWNGEQTRHAYYPRCFKEPCYGSGCKIKDCPFETAVCERLAAYEDTGLTPEEIKAPFTEDAMINLAAQALGVEADRLRELAEADKDGRVVVLPCKVGERWTDEDGRAVQITAVIVSIEPFGTNINIYFDHEDATPDDAGSDCMANWNYFSRHYTCIEVERATEGTTWPENAQERSSCLSARAETVQTGG
nr:MAG TPA: hypothetical protein [Caudoviricetes sp.]